ncbi:MAG: hypothetical protein IPL84_14120 [Chitinophagaceae bacterium]|nr:hypothetical protein [Chitinophagaceae bacterium]
MSRFNIFLTLFILSVLAGITFFVFYIQSVLGLAMSVGEFREDHINSFGILGRIFSPQVVISALVYGLASLAYRIIGIVNVVRNKTVQDGEKALWIVGFVIMGFITAIVFLVMARGRKFVD